jgi:hypothetical protein
MRCNEPCGGRNPFLLARASCEAAVTFIRWPVAPASLRSVVIRSLLQRAPSCATHPRARCRPATAITSQWPARPLSPRPQERCECSFARTKALEPLGRLPLLWSHRFPRRHGRSARRCGFLAQIVPTLHQRAGGNTSLPAEQASKTLDREHSQQGTEPENDKSGKEGYDRAIGMAGDHCCE